MNISSCPYITLGQASNLYNIFKGNDTRKYGKQIEILACEVFKEIARNILFLTKSTYVPLIGGEPFNYVNLPHDCQKFLSASIEEKRCHTLKPLYYNPNLNVLVKPKEKLCSCTACDCGGLCESIGGLTATFKTVTINGTDYTETTYLKYCPNGDIMEYRVIPTTQYTFERGSYDSSYDISYEIGDSDSEVVYYNLSRKLCALAVKPCGCPEQTPENENLFFTNCSCYCNPLLSINKCQKFWGDCNFYAGEVVMSDCQTKLSVKHVQDFADNKEIIITYQTTGIDPDSETTMPDYAKMALFTGIDYYKNLFNDRINPRIKQEQYYKYIDEQNKIIVYQNKFAIEWLTSQPEMANW